MLDIARGKAAAFARVTTAPAGVEIRFEQGNALDLTYADGEFDAATVGFGARNFSDLERGLAEMARVVAPGGRVVVLEITTPTAGVTAAVLRIWFDRIVPLVGRLAGDADAYTYLPSSVRRFPPPRELAALMAKVGLSDVRYVLTAGGIIALHSGVVPDPGATTATTA
jgi:demethylmenaquinone methyltransferase/2-methoxy-6-polyprenyl-1,4-benzoquinol methylase